MTSSRKPTVKELFQRLRRWFHSERQYAEILRLLCAMADTNVLLAEENARQLQNMRDLRDLVQRVMANELHDPVVAHVQAHGIDIVEELVAPDIESIIFPPGVPATKENIDKARKILLT